MLGTIAVALDGIDGWLARRDGTTSRFGALFDQEIDALLILLLSVLVWRVGQGPMWIMAIGAMRYAFLLLGCGVPLFRAPLPPRRRRQVVCVLQSIVLLACLPPLLPQGLRIWFLLFALVALLASFAADVGWLLTRHWQKWPERPANPA